MRRLQNESKHLQAKCQLLLKGVNGPIENENSISMDKHMNQENIQMSNKSKKKG